MSDTDWLDGTGHPARHGYTRCTRCGTWRRDVMRVGVGGPECVEVGWCSAEVARKGFGGSVVAVPVTVPTTGLDEFGDAL